MCDCAISPCDCESKKRKIIAEIELPEAITNVKVGEEISLQIVGKLLFVSAGQEYGYYREDKENETKGRIKVEVSSVSHKPSTQGEMQALLDEDD